jgi:hypothetical protein
MDIVITDLTCPYMVQLASSMTMHLPLIAIQEKTQSFTKWVIGDQSPCHINLWLFSFLF